MFYCDNCGYKSVKWLGKCPLCGGWENFVEEKEPGRDRIKIKEEKLPPKLLKDIKEADYQRIYTGIDGFDCILGGGLVKGEIILIGGEPGVGKSTLLLEVSSKLAAVGKTLYVSAEESSQQIGLRAKRLGSDFSNFYILGEDNLEEAANYIKDGKFKFVMIDSIQAVYSSCCEGSKGSISQIRGCADYLTHIAKSLGVVIFVVGHVTKEGAIAGPKLLEHIVDCVLYFEGETLSNYRILRAIKNRFGPTPDFAVFEMTSRGLKEVKKVTELFLPHKEQSLCGSCVICAIEGIRAFLIELQSLVGRANFSTVRRRSLGFDFNRFSLLIAIIEKRLKISLSSEDVFLNVAGGLKVNDPAADLGAIVAIVSSFGEKEVSLSDVFMAEIGLGGELRRINNVNLRLKEAGRAGFKRCFIPEGNLKEVDKSFNFKIEGFSSVKEVIEKVLR
ncbi:MAG: DNA repair protein RadA [Candidatus Omnitrophica bacterium]|nr:DNA repair protein RadA [Candidatus Omnitrophota bacterium]MBU1133909.1 DNA repair protein RadA [Candidatus Omnitrophota bacterium]MBU1366924.1 DNA repair protein RadA [Candidatus Omnitrophota bacterium]MBU1523170.1 DNA repair protein RadA [Candidatus Omnitrophota bacterium]MBU1810203.1 DNA repair protein RadA [Candidatus Omnitrophota bacterium]